MLNNNHKFSFLSLGISKPFQTLSTNHLHYTDEWVLLVLTQFISSCITSTFRFSVLRTK